MTDTAQTAVPDPLVAATERLEQVLREIDLPLGLAGAEKGRSTARAAAAELRDYIIPRLTDLDAPALVVVGGSTGAGKSTLVNSVVGEDVTVPGVIRPTTRAPVLICHPDDLGWFDGQRILPDLARVRGGAATGTSELQVVTSTSIGEDLALLDAPDIDSVVDANRELAAQLLAAADMWVFVTTAVRYADAVPWQFLRTARDRGTALLIVLNRVPAGALDEVRADLQANLDANGLSDVRIIGIEEQPLVDGHIPSQAVAPLREWLVTLANDHEVRARIVRQTLDGAIGDLLTRSEAVLAAQREQEAAIGDLVERARDPYDDAVRQIGADVRNGAVLRGEVLARWQELIGTGELLRQLQSTLARLRDRITSAITGRKQATDEFSGAVESGVDTLIRARFTEAAQEAHRSWRDHPAGPALLARSTEPLDQPSADLTERSARLVRDWQAGLIELLKQEGAGKRGAAKALSYGVNGLAAVLMVGVFAHTGGLTGTEVAIAGGSSVVGHKLLEALLGDQAVRTLAEKARRDLEERIEALAEHEWRRFTRLLGETEEERLSVRLDGAIEAVRTERARG